MSGSNKRIRLRAYLVSPLPAAVGLLAGGAAHATAVGTDDHYTAVIEAASQKLGNVLANDSGTAPLSASPIPPFSGFISLQPNGDLSYRVNVCSFANHTDTFHYNVTDDDATSASATVTIDVLPAGVDDQYATVVGGEIDGNVRDNDLPASNALFVASLVSSVAHGTLQINTTPNAAVNGHFAYVPDAGFSGRDQFLYASLTNIDSCNLAATVYLVVAPVANELFYDTQANQNVHGNLLDNDVGTNLKLTSVHQPSHGLVANVSVLGTFAYAAQAGFSGDDAFDYGITDADGVTANSVVHVTVYPVATSDAYTTPTGSQLTGNVLSNDVGTGLTASLVRSTSHGTLMFDVDGSFRYTPDANFSGTDSFGYVAADSAGHGGANATAVLTVTPTAVDDHYGTGVGAAVSGNVLTNDQGSGLHVTSHKNPAHGTLNIASDGSFTYTPTPGYSGTDSFAYGVDDASDNTANALVQIAIAQAAQPDFYSTQANTPVSGNMLTNDIGTGLTVSDHTDPSHGSVNVASDGTFSYAPDAGFSGNDSFVYVSRDGGGNISNAVVYVTVDPVIVSDSYTTPAGTPATGNVLTNDLGTGLTVTSNTAASHGSVALAADGTLTYTPAAGFSGFDSFQYDIRDSAGNTASSNAAVQIDVTPVAAPDTFSGSGHGSIHGNVLGNDTGTSLQVTGTPVLPAHGFANVAPDGSFTYFPNPGYSGPDSFQYTVQDGSGQSATATVTINVAAAAPTTPAPATTPAALGLLATLLGWLGLRRRRDT